MRAIAPAVWSCQSPPLAADFLAALRQLEGVLYAAVGDFLASSERAQEPPSTVLQIVAPQWWAPRIRIRRLACSITANPALMAPRCSRAGHVGQ
jgi:hypothetical protein